MTETNTLQKVKSVSKQSTSNEVSKVMVTAFSISAGLIGIWAVACMVAGVVNSGGPISLVSSLFKAILG